MGRWTRTAASVSVAKRTRTTSQAAAGHRPRRDCMFTADTERIPVSLELSRLVLQSKQGRKLGAM